MILFWIIKLFLSFFFGQMIHYNLWNLGLCWRVCRNADAFNLLGFCRGNKIGWSLRLEVSNSLWYRLTYWWLIVIWITAASLCTFLWKRSILSWITYRNLSYILFVNICIIRKSIFRQIKIGSLITSHRCSSISLYKRIIFLRKLRTLLNIIIKRRWYTLTPTLIDHLHFSLLRMTLWQFLLNLLDLLPNLRMFHLVIKTVALILRKFDHILMTSKLYIIAILSLNISSNTYRSC